MLTRIVDPLSTQTYFASFLDDFTHCANVMLFHAYKLEIYVATLLSLVLLRINHGQSFNLQNIHKN